MNPVRTRTARHDARYGICHSRRTRDAGNDVAIATRTAKLSRSCTYSARLPKSRRTRKIKATFGGNDVLSARSSARGARCAAGRDAPEASAGSHPMPRFAA
ncbi:hypothetical protein OJ998_13495 [Solirubrobacter taibaiensis]|nr:hypothetical protein [Solirubrobacter taibaiensis]